MCQATGLQCLKCRTVNNAIKYRCTRPYICHVDIQGIRQSRFPCLRCCDRENPPTPVLGLNSGFSQIAAAASYLRKHETPAARVARLAREAHLALRDQKPVHSLGHKYQFSEYTRHFMRRTGHRPFHYNARERKRWAKRIRNLEEMARQSEKNRERILDRQVRETQYPPSASTCFQAAQTSSTKGQSSYSCTSSRSRSSQPPTPTSDRGFLSRMRNLLRSGSSASANQFQRESSRSRGEERCRHWGDREHHDNRDCDRRGESWCRESCRSESKYRGHGDDDSHNYKYRIKSRYGEDSHYNVRDVRDSHHDDRCRRDRAPRTPIYSDHQPEVAPPMFRDPSSSESHALPFLRCQNATVSQQQKQPALPSPIGRTLTLARVAQLHRQDVSLGKKGNPQPPTDSCPLTPSGTCIPTLSHSNISIGQEAHPGTPMDDSVPPSHPGSARPSSFRTNTSCPRTAAATTADSATGSPIAPSLIAPLSVALSSVSPSAIRCQNFTPTAPRVTSPIAPGQYRGSSNFVPPTLQPEIIPSHHSGTYRHVNIKVICRESAASRQILSSGENSKSNISSSDKVIDDHRNDRYRRRDDYGEGKYGSGGSTGSSQARCHTSIQNMHSVHGRGFINEPLSDIEDADSIASDQEMDGPMMRSDYMSLRNAFLKTTKQAHELRHLPSFGESGGVTEFENIIKFHNIIRYRVTRFSAYKRVIKRNKRTAYVNTDGQFLEKEFERDIGVLDRFLNRLSKVEIDFGHASEVCNQVIEQVRLQEQRRQPTTPQNEVNEVFDRVDDKISRFNYLNSPTKSQTPSLSRFVSLSEIDRNIQAEREIAARHVQFAPKKEFSADLQRALCESMRDSSRKSYLSSPSEQVNPTCRPQDENTAMTHHLFRSTNPDDIKQYLFHSQRQKQAARIQANSSFLEALSSYVIERGLKVEKELESTQKPLRSTNPEDMVQFLLRSQQMARAAWESTLGDVINHSETNISHRAQQELYAWKERTQSEIDLQEAFKSNCPTFANPINVMLEAKGEEALQESCDGFHHPISFLTCSENFQQRAYEQIKAQKRTEGPTQPELSIEQAIHASLQETTRHQFANLGGLIDPSELNLARHAALAHNEQRGTPGPSSFQVTLDQAIEISKTGTHRRLSLRKTHSEIQMEEALELNRNIAQQSPHAFRHLSVRFVDTPSEIQLQEVLEYSKFQTRNVPQEGSDGTSISSAVMMRLGHVHHRASMPSLNVMQSEPETQHPIKSLNVSTKPKSPALNQMSFQADFRHSLELSRQQNSPTNNVCESPSTTQMRQALEEYARLATQKAEDNCLKKELRKAEELSRQSVDQQDIKRLKRLEATGKRLKEAEKKHFAEEKVKEEHQAKVRVKEKKIKAAKEKSIIEENLVRVVKKHELVRAKAKKEGEDILRKEKGERERKMKNEAALRKIEEKKATEAEEATKRKKDRRQKLAEERAVAAVKRLVEYKVAKEVEEARLRKITENKSTEAKRVADLKAAEEAARKKATAEKQAAEEACLQNFANKKSTSENYFATQPVDPIVPASELVVESKPSKPVLEVKSSEPVSESNSNESIAKEANTTDPTTQSTQTPKTELSVIKDTKIILEPTKKSKTPVIDNCTSAEKAKNKAEKTHMKTIKRKERREKLHAAMKAKVKTERSAKRLAQRNEHRETWREEQETGVKEKRAKFKEGQAKAKAGRRAKNLALHDTRNQELKEQAASKRVEEHAAWKKRAERIFLAKLHHQQAKKRDLCKKEAECEPLAKKTKNIAKTAELKKLAEVKPMKSEARTKNEAQFLITKEHKEKPKTDRHAQHLETQKALRAQKRERLHTVHALAKSQRQQAHLARQDAQQRSKAARKATNILAGAKWVKKCQPRNEKPVEFETEPKPEIDLPHHRFQVPDLVYPHPLTKIKDVKVSEPFPLGKHAVSLPFLKEDAKKEAEANEILFHQIQQRKLAKYYKGLYEPSEEEKAEAEKVRIEFKEKICKVLGVGTENPIKPVEEPAETVNCIIKGQEKELVEEEVKEEEASEEISREVPEDVVEESTIEPKEEPKLKDFFAHREQIPEVADEMVANIECCKHTPSFDKIDKMILSRPKEYIRNKFYYQPWKLPGFPKIPIAAAQKYYGFSKAQSGAEYLRSLQQIISDHRERVQSVYSVFNSDDPAYDQYDNDETTDPRITPMPDSREESDISDNDAASVAHADRQAVQLKLNPFVPIYKGSKAEDFEELRKEGMTAYFPFANCKNVELANIPKAEEDVTEKQFEEVVEKKYDQDEDTTKENDEPVQEEIQDETVKEKKESTKLPEVTAIKVRYTRYEYPILDYEVHSDDESSNMGLLVPDVPYPVYDCNLAADELYPEGPKAPDVQILPYYYDYFTEKEEEVEDQVPELEKSSKDAMSATAAATNFSESSSDSLSSSNSDDEVLEPKNPEDDSAARPFYGRRFTDMFQRPKTRQVTDDAISPRSFPTLQDDEDEMKPMTKVQRLRMAARMAAQKRRGTYYVKMRQVAEGTWVKYYEQQGRQMVVV